MSLIVPSKLLSVSFNVADLSFTQFTVEGDLDIQCSCCLHACWILRVFWLLYCFGIKTGDELDQYKIIVLPEYLPYGAFFHVLSESSSKLWL